MSDSENMARWITGSPIVLPWYFGFIEDILPSDIQYHHFDGFKLFKEHRAQLKIWDIALLMGKWPNYDRRCVENDIYEEKSCGFHAWLSFTHMLGVMQAQIL